MAQRVQENGAHGGPWTRFMDMHSGGGTKEPPFEFIYIEAPEAEAKVVFYNRFGHNPERVTCACCGDDYSIGEEPSLAQATAYNRGCEYDDEAKVYVERLRTRFMAPGHLLTVEEYAADPTVLVIPADEIRDAERVGDVPAQGYVWVD